ncbi:type II toxin-antitoxin system RelB/DinJ family antitoxin [Pantoea agglomerans]
MAAINIKMDSDLKDRGDMVLRENGLNTTQGITHFYEYIAHHGKLPFITEKKHFSAGDLTLVIATQFSDSINQLHKIRDLLNSDVADFAEIAAAKLELSRLAAGILQNGWRLESLPDDNVLTTPARRMLPRINYHLAGCDFSLSNLPAVLPVPASVVNAFGISLRAYETELTLLQSILRDSGLLPRPEPAREFVFRDENITISVIQPDEYQHGAWIIRMQAKSVDHQNALEGAGLIFPELEGRVFLPGTVYGKAVLNYLTGKYEMGFRFRSGFSEFHMYSSGHEEEQNPTSPDRVAESLSLTVYVYLQELLNEMATRS